jgi:hypothetical protein
MLQLRYCRTGIYPYGYMSVVDKPGNNSRRDGRQSSANGLLGRKDTGHVTYSETSVREPIGALVAALAVHAVTLPWWVAIGALLGGGLVQDYGEAPAYVVVAALVAVWVWLATLLVRWWRQARGPLWSYPLRWGLMLGFAWALLIPPVWRLMRPKYVVPRDTETLT